MKKIQALGKWKEIEGDLKQLEKYLYTMSLSNDPQVSSAIEHIISAGGKRTRPAFALLVSKLYNCPNEKIMPLIASLELVHTASLIHDDIIDGAGSRRGLPTINAMEGNKMAISTGDFLIGAALKLLVNYEDKRIAEIMVSTVKEMAKGELRQLDDFYKTEQTLQDYLYRIQRKTAILFATSCRTGALVSGASEFEANVLRRFGYYLGMSFQIIDDVLDMTSDEKSLQKPVASDLRSGNLSLPVVYALHNSPDKDQIKAMILARPTEEKEVRAIIKMVIDCGGIDYANAFSDRYLQKAQEQLNLLPEGEYLDTLRVITNKLGKRKK